MSNIKKVLIVLAIIFAFCLGRDFFVKSIIGTVASNITGAPTSIGGLSLSVMGQSIKISDFKMRNPQGFPDDVLVDIPKMNVAWDLGAFMKGKIHLKILELDIKEIGVAKNKEGKYNVDSLKITEKKEGSKSASQLPMQIDFLNLEMGQVVHKNYSVQGPPSVKVYNVNLKKSYKNITSAQQLAALMISEPLKAAGIQGLEMYGVTMLTGVAALPVAVAFTLGGKDYDRQDFNVSFEKAYEIGLRILKKAGTVKSENKDGGVIGAEVKGAHLVLKLKKGLGHSTQVTISARRLGFPQPEVASGVMYEIAAQLK